MFTEVGNAKHAHYLLEESPHDVMAKMLDSGLEVSKFKPHLY